MLIFGTHIFNESEILRIDLWFSNSAAKVCFIDNGSIVLNELSTMEARAWAENERRMQGVADEKEMLSLEDQRYYMKDRERKDRLARAKKKKKNSSGSRK